MSKLHNFQPILLSKKGIFYLIQKNPSDSQLFISYTNNPLTTVLKSINVMQTVFFMFMAWLIPHKVTITTVTE